MAEIRLAAIRIGFPYSVDIIFPSGFLAPEENVRTKFRRYLNDPEPIVPTASRSGDTITWELDEGQTGAMSPGTYIAEAEVYNDESPGIKGIPLTNNRYIADCDHSPAE